MDISNKKKIDHLFFFFYFTTAEVISPSKLIITRDLRSSYKDNKREPRKKENIVWWNFCFFVFCFEQYFEKFWYPHLLLSNKVSLTLHREIFSYSLEVLFFLHTCNFFFCKYHHKKESSFWVQYRVFHNKCYIFRLMKLSLS